MTFFRRLWYFLTKRRRQAELDEEMRLHVELREARNQRDGLAPAGAARAARVRFGNQLKLREESRDAWGFVLVERVARDFRDALRYLLRRPMWTATVVATLALGVGANTSLFTLTDSLFFQPLGNVRPDRLVWLTAIDATGRPVSVSYPRYVAYRDDVKSLAEVMAFGHVDVSVGGPHPDRARGSLASSNYFDVLGIHAAVGRTFLRSDDVPNAPPVAIIADAFWRSHFGGDPGIVNHAVTMNGQPVTIVGVAPRGFSGTEPGVEVALWLPLAMEPLAMPGVSYFLTDPSEGWLRVIGRLTDGAGVAQANAELQVVAAALSSAAPRDKRQSAMVPPAAGALDPEDRAHIGPAIGLLSIAPLLVLLVACANVANLVMARNVGRQREFAMRRAIGASRWQVVRGLFAEAVVLALVSAIVGYAVSYALTALVAHVGDVSDEVTQAMQSSWRVVAVTGMLALSMTFVFGLLPALTATRFDVGSALKDSGGAVSSGRGRRRLRSAFVVTQVALSLALLVTAGLFVQSLAKALRVDPGFDMRHAVTMTFDTNLQRYNEARRARFVVDLVERTRAVPGVSAVGVTSLLPFGGFTSGTRVSTSDGTNETRAYDNGVTANFFDAMGIRVLAGRAFTEGDARGPLVAIVNETLAKRLWPAGGAVGHQLMVDGRLHEVVGVAPDAKYTSLTETPFPTFYEPFAQYQGSLRSPISLVARTGGDEGAILRSLTDAAQSVDRDMPAFRVETLTDLMRAPSVGRSAVASLLGVFGMLTLAIAAIGLYGVAAHNAAMRRREVGLRMALGAQPGDVRRLFVRQTLALAAVGVAIGCAVSLAGSRLLASFLFDLAPTDALTFAGAAALLAVVAVAASYLPARAAARVNPVIALRQD